MTTCCYYYFVVDGRLVLVFLLHYSCTHLHGKIRDKDMTDFLVKIFVPACLDILMRTVDAKQD